MKYYIIDIGARIANFLLWSAAMLWTSKLAKLGYIDIW